MRKEHTSPFKRCRKVGSRRQGRRWVGGILGKGVEVQARDGNRKQDEKLNVELELKMEKARCIFTITLS